MHWIDWIIVCVPLLVVSVIGVKTRKYVKGVSDFLTAGRVAGRYVVCVATAEAGVGLITLVMYFEVFYKSGFAYGFWQEIVAPLLIVLGLTGYCNYRFRETRAMTLGQFLEIRYNRPFRIFAAILQSISGIINYALFPAVGARFLVYFCELPLEISIGGFLFPTFALVMAIFLCVAVFVATMGGQITIMVTDCLQGILSYPLYAVVVIYIFFKFSWFNDMAPTLLDRPAGQSLINPFDIAGLRDFNLFFVMVGIFGNVVMNRLSFSGTQAYNTAALNAHEQKMGGVLAGWRAGFSWMMIIILAVVAYTYLNSEKYIEGPKGSTECRKTLASKAFDDVARDEKFDVIRDDYKQYLATGEITASLQKRIDEVEAEELATEKAAGNTAKTNKVQIRETAKEAVDKEPMLTVGRTVLKSISKNEAQTFGTIFGQMRVPMALKSILPVGLIGSFCALCVFLLISTDTTYMHSWGAIIVQDLILPLRGRPFTPKQQLTLLRVIITFVAVFAFFFSLFFGQFDYIMMYFAITGAIWLGGAGICIVGGLYWKRGTSSAAFAALISGSGLSTLGVFFQNFWVDKIYPFIVSHGWLEEVTKIVEGASAPFEPFIEWRVTPDKFPINSQEVYAITLLISIGLYLIISLLTCRRPYNMDRMLHRGKYRREGKPVEHKLKGFKDILLKLIGINEEYTLGDKILAWSVFIWSFVWLFLISFVLIAVWNTIKPWPNEWWTTWFFIYQIIVPGIVAVISTVWFTIGGTWDLRRMFKRLEEKEVSILDDGCVIGNISAEDIALVNVVDEGRIIESISADEAALIEEIGNVNTERILVEKKLTSKDDREVFKNLPKHEKQDNQLD